MDKLVHGEKGTKMMLLGNEAIVRGALEAGIGFSAAYPGTPSSEISDTFSRIAKDAGIHFEYSVNEKVAMETVAAVAASGVRAMTQMKHVGLNVASDAFMTSVYTGTRAGLVVVTADDPSMHSSQNEQDNRIYSKLSGVPMLEPSSPHEAKEMARKAFDISEELESPILLRTTTRISHVRGVVEFEDRKSGKLKGHFDKDPFRFVTIPSVARKQHKILLEKEEKARKMADVSEFNRIIGDGKIGFMTSGAAFNYLMEVVEDMGIDYKILKLGFTHPFPSGLFKEFMEGIEKLIVVEEGEPYLEEYAFVYSRETRPEMRIYGKYSDHFPRLYEYNPDVVEKGVSASLGMEYRDRKPEYADMKLPDRPPALCPGCPHRATYYAARKVFMKDKDKVVYPTDIGCYTLGIQPPYELADYLLCMGSSIGSSNGFSEVTDQLPIAFIGDSTFFHSGVPALINAVYNEKRLIYVILDNSTTAMTGHQPNPGMGKNGMGDIAPVISIENVVKGCGVEWVRTVDSYDLPALEEAFKEAAENDGVSVIISKHPCALLESAAKKKAGTFHTYRIDQDKCIHCHVCSKHLACPAIYITEDGLDMIDEKQCTGCGVCADICPAHAISEVKE